MAKKLLEKFTGATTGVVLSLGAIAGQPARAEIVDYDFIVTSHYENNAYQEFRGQLSFDAQSEIVTAEQGWMGKPIAKRTYQVHAIEFFFNNRIYTEADALSPICLSFYETLDEQGTVLTWETADFYFTLQVYRSEAVWTAFQDKTTAEKQWGMGWFSPVEEPTAIAPKSTPTAGINRLNLGWLFQNKVRRYA